VKITKHIHACLELEKGGARLLIDPGSYTEDMSQISDVLAVVITHSHDDHCDEAQLQAIAAKNPGVKIFGTAEVAKRLTGFEVTTVMHGDYHEVGPYRMEFFGDMHQEIHPSIPLIQNVAVMVDDTLYYPGDSYTQPDRPVKLLACPTSAPWLKIADVMDFIAELRPEKCFPSHNVHLSEIGNELNNSRVKGSVEAAGGKFSYLKVGDSLEI